MPIQPVEQEHELGPMRQVPPLAQPGVQMGIEQLRPLHVLLQLHRLGAVQVPRVARQVTMLGSQTGDVHCTPDHPASQTQGVPGAAHVPWRPQAGVHTATSQRVPVHPVVQTQALAFAHTPWSHPSSHTGWSHRTPVHPEASPQAQTPGALQTP